MNLLLHKLVKLSQRWLAERVITVRPAMLCVVCTAFILQANPITAQHRRKAEVPKEIVQQLMKDEDIKDFLEYKNEYTISGLAKYLVGESIDLNRDRKPEIVVHGIEDICGANNCAYWVYRKTANGYQLILDAGSINHIELKNTFTNSYRDLVTAMHGSAFDSGLAVYKFDGKRYQLKECFQRYYANYEDKHGRFHVSKRPTITRVKYEPE